jgi:5-methylcytosine-specific restriction endonuclease McrA
MACLKCGSDWVTKKGKDRLSCPECCKQSRHKARALGLIPSSEIKSCQRCANQFEAVGANAIARAKFCRECKGEARKEYLRDRLHRIKHGGHVPNAVPEKARGNCEWCQGKLRKSQTKYCCPSCFHAARSAGVQPWDRSNQEQAAIDKSVLQCQPSKKPMHALLTSMHSFLRKVRRLARFAAIRWRPCKECGLSSERRICSSECQIAWDNKRKVRRRAAKKAYNKVAGRHFKQRAKRFGVRYIRFAKSMIYERDGYICQLCRKPVLQTVKYNAADGKIHMRSPTIDHIIPLSKGGNHEPPNCQTACFECNSKKGNRRAGQLRLAID